MRPVRPGTWEGHELKAEQRRAGHRARLQVRRGRARSGGQLSVTADWRITSVHSRAHSSVHSLVCSRTRPGAVAGVGMETRHLQTVCVGVSVCGTSKPHHSVVLPVTAWLHAGSQRRSDYGPATIWNWNCKTSGAKPDARPNGVLAGSRQAHGWALGERCCTAPPPRQPPAAAQLLWGPPRPRKAHECSVSSAGPVSMPATGQHWGP